MEIPITIKTGAIAAIGIIETIGAKKIVNKKKNATNTDVRPVLPPDSIPTVLSK